MWGVCIWLLVSRKGQMGGRYNGSLVSPTSFFFFFFLFPLYARHCHSFIRTGYNKDAFLKTMVQRTIRLLGADYLLSLDDVRIPYFSSGWHPEFLLQILAPSMLNQDPGKNKVGFQGNFWTTQPARKIIHKVGLSHSYNCIGCPMYMSTSLGGEMGLNSAPTLLSRPNLPWGCISQIIRHL